MANGLIGALLVSLGIDTAAFNQGLKGAEKATKGFGANLDKLGKAALFGIAAAAATAGTAMVKFGSDALNSADAIGDAAQLMGIGVENLQALQIAFRNAGAEPQLFDEAMTKLNKNLGDFLTTGKGTAAEAFKELGLSSQITTGQIKGADEVFLAVTKAMEGIEDPAIKASLSAKLFGKSAGTDMVEVLSAGSAAINKYVNAAKASGQVFSKDEIDKLSTYRQNLKDMQLAMTNMATVFGGKAVIAIGDFAVKMKPMFEELKKVTTQVMDFLSPSIVALSEAFTNFAKSEGGALTVSILKTMAAVIGGAVVVAFKMLISKATTIINSFASITNWVAKMVNAIQVNFARLKGIMQPAIDMVNKVNHAFFKLEDDVTGHSYVPDMVDAIGFHFGRLENEMVSPSMKATKLTGDAFKNLEGDVKSLLDRLKTDDERSFETFNESLLVLETGLKNNVISLDNYREALRRVNEERNSFRGDALGNIGSISDSLKLPESINAREDIDNFIKEHMAKAIANDNKSKDAFKELFSGGMKSAMNGNLKDFAKNWWQDVLNNAMTNAFNNLAGGLYDIFKSMGSNSSGGTSSGFTSLLKTIGSIFTSSPKNAQGGTYGIRGGGGTDSRLFTSWVSPNELVQIGHPSDFNGGGGQMAQINVYNNGILTQSEVVDLAQREAVNVTAAAFDGVNQAQLRNSQFRVG